MPPRQVWLFKFGCWATIGTAVVLLVAHLAWPVLPLGGSASSLAGAIEGARVAVPGSAERSVADVLGGLNLVVALLLATMGAAGLVVQARARHDAVLMAAVARTYGVSSVALLGVSLTNFFLVSSFLIALMVISFLVAAVESPELQMQEGRVDEAASGGEHEPHESGSGAH